MPVWEVDLTDAKRARLRNKLDTHVEEEKFDTFFAELEGQATIQAAANAIGDADLKQISKDQWQIRLSRSMRLAFVQIGLRLTDFQVGHT
ncbi:hypothetical protein MTZ49_07275 [Entomomonas sp. E2T0]|uniref:hypothetical protein n=1 Tax=Entomomonas sp. E2T0 TaxID=2930213 RepID=UPI0022285023|nr:hypothetical protein [Entomomonas sp. E2T0]UYZ85340.1 hypothetical protein MTZ49_07275 [Entomomonas sp. E2T0]